MSRAVHDTEKVESPGSARRLVRTYPLATFIVLAYLVNWAAVATLGDPLGSGPFFVAVFVLSMTKGWPGIRALFRQMTKWRVHWKWYLVALGLPSGAAILAALGTVALGAPRPTSAQIGLWTEIVPFFLFALIVPMLGPWEEPGFRGFALSRLMRERSILVSSLLVGVIIVFWHTPLFFTGDIPAGDVVLIMAGAIVFAWLVVGTGGSVLLAMVMHATSNAVSGEYISEMFTGSDAEVLGWLRAGIWCVFAAVVVLTNRRILLTSPDVALARANDRDAEKLEDLGRR
jgi:membrane protease YdiL (CAAX protease family)